MSFDLRWAKRRCSVLTAAGTCAPEPELDSLPSPPLPVSADFFLQAGRAARQAISRTASGTNNGRRDMGVSVEKYGVGELSYLLAKRASEQVSAQITVPSGMMPPRGTTMIPSR